MKDPNPNSDRLERIEAEIVACRLCPRLVEWRERVALDPPLRFRGQEYWAKAIPGWGDFNARLMIVGLAPAAHGGNRTGRLFTGDRSGDWLFRALWKAGFANQPTSTARDDGLFLRDCYIAAACRCAPPDNKPLPIELLTCRPYLQREMRLMKQVKVILGLGKIGFDAAFDTTKSLSLTSLSSRPKFGHGVEIEIAPALILMGTYHPSQQNTFTGRLTEAMLDAIFDRARQIMNGAAQEPNRVE